ncbi:MAG: hypothetical protein JW751_21145 [Polyangiaceae bacterium]|nr:hypothetical protein [Polyangiaceae bacterium]
MQDAVATTLVLAFFVLNFVQKRILRARRIDPRGAPPLPRVQFALAKLTMVAAWLAIPTQACVTDLRLVAASSLVAWAAVATEALGLALVALGYSYLGDANQMGLGRPPAALQTADVYGFSRNPIYLGFHLLTVAAATYTLDPFVFGFGLVSVVLHDRIVRAEEAHLPRELGPAYERYRTRVRGCL